ncbi:MAG: aminoglycoside phosphotransferase family protein [Chloroflexi bacterium]|nr:aminoglycoside phosphotransferase family protein [Chloroflexota bacterium]
MNAILADSPTALLTPPITPRENQACNWFSLPNSDLVTDHLTAVLWDQDVAPDGWQAAQLSPAAYVYCEKGTGWKVVVKFHAPKTGKDAIQRAEREYRLTQQARECLGADREFRAAQPLGLWRGALFLEFVEGLTLEDKIAVRRSQPGELIHAIETVGKFLSKLHSTSSQQKIAPDFGQAADYAYGLVDNLAKHGVLQNHSSVQNGLGRLIEKWATDPLMWNYRPTRNHGDGTTSNFIFPPKGGLVAIDWERSETADPAADLGRLRAEITHSVNRFGGDFVEGLVFANCLTDAYCNQLPSNWNTENLVFRARFYQAACTLGIARSGWLSRQDRLALVLRAFALLSK